MVGVERQPADLDRHLGLVAAVLLVVVVVAVELLVGLSRRRSSSGAIGGNVAAATAQRLARRRDVVDAEHPRAALEARTLAATVPGDAVVRVGRARQPADERLARDADEDGEAERDDLVEAAQQLEVVLERLAEADARGRGRCASSRDALGDGERGALAPGRP